MKLDHADIVQEAGEHDLLVVTGLERVGRALQQMSGRGEPLLEEIDQLRLVRHLRQSWVGAHEEVLAGVLRLQRGAALDRDLAVGHVEQHRLGGDLLAEVVHHPLFELVRLLREVQRSRRGLVCHLKLLTLLRLILRRLILRRLALRLIVR